LAGGALLLVAGLFLSLPANAASPYDRDGGYSTPEYTRHASRVSNGRVLYLYIDRDFDQRERQHVVSAVRQWNHVLNGGVRIEARLLPEDASPADLQRVRRAGGWIVARVDSRHPVAHHGEGTHALAVTVGGSGGGYVYVISDRIGNRDLTGVIMHEFGHVLGAGHDQSGLMAPVYNAAGARCIDFEAASLVAKVQRLSVRDMNWCEVPGRGPGPAPGPSYNQGYRSGTAISGLR
jgi:hypothetical protein